MIRSPWLALALLALLTGCRADSTGADTRRYACVQEADCVPGFACLAGFCQRPVTPPLGDAGEDSDTDAGNPGGGDGGTDGGTGPVPGRLGFVTPAQTVTAGQCSSPATVETQTAAGNGAVVDSAVTVTLSAPAGSGVTFFQDASCTSTTTTATVAAGASRATFYFRGTTAQGVTVTAAASGLTSAQQLQTVRAAAPASLVFTTSAQSLDVGACSARVELELRDAYANPASFSSQTRLTPSGTGLYFSSDSACNTSVTDAPFAANASRTSFYFRSRPSGTVRLTASVSGLPSVAQDQSVQSLQTTVRTGTCEIGSSSLTTTCTLSPALSDTTKTMLFIQAVGPGLYPSEASARCWLASRSTITCSRNSASGGDVFPIWWKTVEMATGLKVQHLQPTCSTRATNLPVFINSVSAANTFLLVSSENDGVGLDTDDFFTAKLTSSSRVDLQFSTPCSRAWKGALQVVELSGARVTRGTSAMAVGATQAPVSSLSSVDPTTSVLLHTHRVTTSSSPSKLCDRVLRGELSSATSVHFFRGAGASGCGASPIEEISWERVDFGPLARVQSRLIEFPAGNRLPASTPLISAVETARTVVFSGAQSLGGQAGGESNHDNPVIAEALAGLTLASSTELSAQRIPGNTYSYTKVNACVVQFEP
ncbi:MAG: hypothetical protein ABW123_18855 [Cystobacter sp.]